MVIGRQALISCCHLVSDEILTSVCSRVLQFSDYVVNNFDDLNL